MIGFLSVLSVSRWSLMSYGVLPQRRSPATPSLRCLGLESIVATGVDPHPGRRRVSVLGAYLAWSLMAAEIIYIPAKPRICLASWRGPTARVRRWWLWC